MPLSDLEIYALARAGMISNFCPQNVRRVSNDVWPNLPVISYGLGPYGYDLRLSSVEFFIFKPGVGEINPKRFDHDKFLTPAELRHDADGEYFVMPPNSYALGVALERLEMPADVTGLCIGKSTYARVGKCANLTPVEAGWRGHLTLEFANLSGNDLRVYANEGVAQVLFFKGQPCRTAYSDRDGAGKYQDQPHGVVPAKV